MEFLSSAINNDYMNQYNKTELNLLTSNKPNDNDDDDDDNKKKKKNTIRDMELCQNKTSNDNLIERNSQNQINCNSHNSSTQMNSNHDDDTSTIIHVESDVNVSIIDDAIKTNCNSTASIVAVIDDDDDDDDAVVTANKCNTTKIRKKGGEEQQKEEGEDVSSHITNSSTNYSNENTTTTSSCGGSQRSCSSNPSLLDSNKYQSLPTRQQKQQQQQQEEPKSPIVYPPPMSWYQQDVVVKKDENTKKIPKQIMDFMNDNNSCHDDDNIPSNSSKHDHPLSPLSPLSFDGVENHNEMNQHHFENGSRNSERKMIETLTQSSIHDNGNLRSIPNDGLNLPDIQEEYDSYDDQNTTTNSFHLHPQQREIIERGMDSSRLVNTSSLSTKTTTTKSIITSNTRNSPTTRSSINSPNHRPKRFLHNKKKSNNNNNTNSNSNKNNNKSKSTNTSITNKTTKQLSTTMKSIHTLTTDYLPHAAQELVYTSSRNLFHYTRKTYNQSMLFGKLQLQFSEMGNKIGGYDYATLKEEGICDERNGEVLWSMDSIREKYYYHLNDYTFYSKSYDDENENHGSWDGSGSSESYGMTKTKKKQFEHHGKGSFLKKKNHGGKERIDPSSPEGITTSSLKGFGWEDEWDRQRVALPPFSSLNWVDRQLVKEWRTCEYITQKLPLQPPSNATTSNHVLTGTNAHDGDSKEDEDFYNGEEIDFDQARKFIPKPMPRPPWENALSCYTCRKLFNSTRLRHHCRLCGRSYCHDHSKFTHRLPHLGYDPDVPERTCGQCKHYLEIQNLAERIAWRMARCRDYLVSPTDLCPYFETGVDTIEDAAVRLTKAAINLAKSIPLGAQATVAVETLDVLRKHGLKGVYGLILRKEFMAAADLLCKVTGINKKVWPLSVHELSAAIFYALAQHRALRGIDPEREHRMHAIKEDDCLNDDDNESFVSTDSNYGEQILDETMITPPLGRDPQHCTSSNNENNSTPDDDATVDAVCEAVPDSLLASLIFYAPVAMNFIYAATEVDMQLLAAQQGWRLIYAHLKQDVNGSQISDMPASALFVHVKQKIACFSVRGTATINDVVTDIRAMPVQFPDLELGVDQQTQKQSSNDEDDWMKVSRGQGLALCGMAGAAYNLFRENIETLLLFARQGYRIRLVGHSLGGKNVLSHLMYISIPLLKVVIFDLFLSSSGGVAALLGALVRREMEAIVPKQGLQNTIDFQNEGLRVYSYGSPACVDAKLSEYAKTYVTNCVLHDDVIPRLTPTSIRALLKHLLYIRETWVKDHLTNDLMAITERAKKAWAPRLRNGFNLMSAKKPSLKLYKKLKAKSTSIQKKLTGQQKFRNKELDLNEDKIHREPEKEEKLVEKGSVHEGDYFFEAEELIENVEYDRKIDEVIAAKSFQRYVVTITIHFHSNGFPFC